MAPTVDEYRLDKLRGRPHSDYTALKGMSYLMFLYVLIVASWTWTMVLVGDFSSFIHHLIAFIFFSIAAAITWGVAGWYTGLRDWYSVINGLPGYRHEQRVLYFLGAEGVRHERKSGGVTRTGGVEPSEDLRSERKRKADLLGSSAVRVLQIQEEIG